MKKLITLISFVVFTCSIAFAQHVQGNDGKTYYDAAKTKLKEVFNYKQVTIFSEKGDHSIVGTEQKKHGPYFYYYENGKIRISGNYKDDLKTGTWKYFDENGKMIKTETYEKGKLVPQKKPNQ